MPDRRQTLVALALASTGLPVAVASDGVRPPSNPSPAMNSSTMTKSPSGKQEGAGAPPMPAVPPEALSRLGTLQLTGQGNLRFFGLLVYDIRLWASSRFMAELYDRHPFVLELQYARKLEGAAIAERSIAEMRRVGSFDEAQAQRWVALMKQAFPNVKAQDRLSGAHDGEGGVQFFFNGQLTGAIHDARFAQLFFGIWLHPKTSAPSLRSALIGDLS